MFKKTKAAFSALYAAIVNLANTIETNTVRIEKLIAEQTELRSKLDTIAEHSRYQALAKKQELQRSGQPHSF